MIFGPEMIAAIFSGEKKVTRRHSCSLREGGIYAVQPGRGRCGVAHFEVLSIRQERLGEIDDADAHREGFRDRAGFIAYWEQLYGCFDLEQLVYRIEFELVRGEER